MRYLLNFNISRIYECLVYIVLVLLPLTAVYAEEGGELFRKLSTYTGSNPNTGNAWGFVMNKEFEIKHFPDFSKLVKSVRPAKDRYQLVGFTTSVGDDYIKTNDIYGEHSFECVLFTQEMVAMLKNDDKNRFVLISGADSFIRIKNKFNYEYLSWCSVDKVSAKGLAKTINYGEINSRMHRVTTRDKKTYWTFATVSGGLWFFF